MTGGEGNQNELQLPDECNLLSCSNLFRIKQRKNDKYLFLERKNLFIVNYFPYLNFLKLALMTNKLGQQSNSSTVRNKTNKKSLQICSFLFSFEMKKKL